MRKIFLDTNILVDLIADRKPFSKFAIEIFKKGEEGKIILYTSSHSIVTTHYLLKKYVDDLQLRKIINNLLEFIQIVPVDLDSIKKSLKSKYKDLEDAIQIFSAYKIEDIDCIVTRNSNDFKGTEISVLTPDELLNHL